MMSKSGLEKYLSHKGNRIASSGQLHMDIDLCDKWHQLGCLLLLAHVSACRCRYFRISRLIIKIVKNSRSSRWYLFLPEIRLRTAKPCACILTSCLSLAAEGDDPLLLWRSCRPLALPLASNRLWITRVLIASYTCIVPEAGRVVNCLMQITDSTNAQPNEWLSDWMQATQQEVGSLGFFLVESWSANVANAYHANTDFSSWSVNRREGWR